MEPGDGGPGPSGGTQDEPLRRIAVGAYELEVGDPAGVAIALSAEKGGDKPLARALAKCEQEQHGTAPQALEGALEDASRVTSKVEHAKTLCSQVLSGKLDIESVTNETDALLGLAHRLDRAGRFEEELRVARCLSTLVTLARRWLDLLRLLRSALRAAEHATDQHAKAWAQHELGTLHLAAGSHAGADRWLSQARELRERLGDRRGMALTERNLQVLCRTLRHALHEQRRGHTLERRMSRPVLALLAAVVLIAAGGTAGAVIDHSTRPHPRIGDTVASRVAGPGTTPSKTPQPAGTAAKKAVPGPHETRPEILLVCPRSPLGLEVFAPAFGSITPPRAGVEVIVMYTGPKSVETVKTQTNAAGVYSADYMPREGGEWHVQSESAASTHLTGASSRSCTFIVEIPRAGIVKALLPKTTLPSGVRQGLSTATPPTVQSTATTTGPATTGPSTTETERLH